MAPYRWVELIQAELEAGAWKVIAEARETGTAGIFRPDGEVRMGLIDEIAHAIDPDRLRLRGAAARTSRSGSSSASGATSNLGNIAPGGRPVAGDAAPRPALGHDGGRSLSGIFLARHGETPYNAEGRFQGHLPGRR